MKHAKKTVIIAVLLLFAMLGSSLGQAVAVGLPGAASNVASAAAARASEAVSQVGNLIAQPLSAHYSPVKTSSTLHKGGDGLFQAKFEGSSVTGSGASVDGVYRFTAAQTDGEAWHVKLESNYPTVAGRDYRVTYRFTSDVGGKIKFGDFQEFQIEPGENSVTGVLIATGGTSYLDLQLGMLPPFTIDFSEIEVEEYADEVEYDDALSSPVNFEKESVVYEKHDQGYAPVLTRSSDGVSINYVASPWDPGVWKSRLYIKTGLIPQGGTSYRITADVECDQDMPFEVLFNNDDQEKGYGALYGQKLTAGEVTTCEAVITGTSDGDELVLQFSLGEAPEESTVKIGNLHVETITDHYTNALRTGFALDKDYVTGRINTKKVPKDYTTVVLPGFSYTATDTVYEQHDSDYVVSLEETATSATLKITQAPEDRGVWKAKLFAATGVNLEAGTTYRIKFNLASTEDQADYEVCFDGSTENAYGALYGRSLTAGGTDAVEYIVTPSEDKGPLTLRLQLGKTDSTAGNTVTFSDLTVESLTVTATDLGPIDYTSQVNVWEQHWDGVEQWVSASGNTATLHITQGRSGGGVWSSQLYIATGVVPEAGVKYRVTATVAATGDTGEFEILYQNRDAENLGGRWGLNGSGTYIGDFTTPASGSGELWLRFQLGHAAAGNTITISNLSVCKVTDSPTNVSMPGFAYPYTADPEVVPAGFAEQTVALSAESIAYDGFVQTASVSGGKATLSITEARTPGLGGIWSSRLHVGTGLALVPGVEYEISAKVSATKAIYDFQLLFSNGSEENDEYNLWGKGYHDGCYGLSVEGGGSTTVTQTFTVPELSEYKPLVLRFQLGESPADNVITVSDIHVKKWTPEHTVDGETEPNSFLLETNAGTSASLYGDGYCAVSLVNQPGDDWHIKLYARTGVTLHAGQPYIINMNISGAENCWVVYKNADTGAEDGFGAEQVTLGNQVLRHTVTPDADGALEIIVKMGTVPAGSSVVVAGIQVQMPGEIVGPNLMTSSLCSYAPVNFWAHEDYAAWVGNTASSATLTLVSSPDAGREFWKVKLFVETGKALSAGKHYRISASVSASADTDYEICYNNGAVEKGVGALYGLHASTAPQTVTYEVTPASDANLILQFCLGQALSGTAVTVSNVKVEELNYTVDQNLLPDFKYNSVGFVRSTADGGYITNLERSGDSVTFRILQAPDERHAWNARVYLRTGFTPEADKGYRVSYDVTAERSQQLYESFYDGTAEMAYGALYEQTMSSGKQTVSYIIMPGDSKGELTVQFRPGQTDGTEGNAYKISNFKVEEVTFDTLKWPETLEISTLYVHEDYRAKLEKSPNADTVKFEKTPAEGREAWKTKLFIDTGTVLRTGQKYRVSFDVKSIIPAPFEVCFNKGQEEKGIGAIFGLISTPSGQHVDYVTYAKEDAPLVIQVSLGNCTAPNSIIVSNVKVEKAGRIDPVSDTVYTF